MIIFCFNFFPRRIHTSSASRYTENKMAASDTLLVKYNIHLCIFSFFPKWKICFPSPIGPFLRIFLVPRIINYTLNMQCRESRERSFFPWYFYFFIEYFISPRDAVQGLRPLLQILHYLRLLQICPDGGGTSDNHFRTGFRLNQRLKCGYCKRCDSILTKLFHIKFAAVPDNEFGSNMDIHSPHTAECHIQILLLTLTGLLSGLL